MDGRDFPVGASLVLVAVRVARVGVRLKRERKAITTVDTTSP